jgi:hypothetical protein
MRVLVAAYTVLAVAAGARAGVQLATDAAAAPVPYTLSAVAAAVELAGVLGVGTAELVGAAAWPDQTVWSGYGAGYGFAPLVLPVAALLVLRRRWPARSG